MKGFDISKYQGNKIDFVAAKKAGYEFVIIRIGYNKSQDTYFLSNYSKATEAGLLVGVYFYTLSTTVEGAKNDANMVLKWLSGKKLSLPIAYDIEESSMKGSSRKALNSQIYNTFSSIINNNGYKSMLYTGESMFNSSFDKNAITDPLWIAKYSSTKPNVGKDIAIWQYTSGAIKDDFYIGALDRNIMYCTVDELMKTTKTSSTTTSANIKKGFEEAYKFTTKRDSNIKKAIARVLQHAMNLDYKSGLVEDGIWGDKSNAALSTHYIKKGEKQYMVTAAEIIMYLLDKNPNGVEYPGTFGNGLEKACGASKITATMFKSYL